MERLDEYNFVRYDASLSSIWDEFVCCSRNATFLFERSFMDYHADRFEDYSLCVYRKQKLVAVLPAHRKGNSLFSHQGLTYGGFALAKSLHGNETLALFCAFRDWLSKESFAEMIYKPVPSIYHSYPSDDELYALHRVGATLCARSLSATLAPSHQLGYNSLRKRGVKRANLHGLDYSFSSRWGDYWCLLSTNLAQRHDTTPVHSLEEIQLLNRRFPQQIKLFTAESAGELLAGVVLFDTPLCVHVQYIAASEQGKKNGALDGLFDRLIQAEYGNKRWFDFGVSTEQSGSYLNENLLLQKEGFGARGVVYDCYRIEM